MCYFFREEIFLPPSEGYRPQLNDLQEQERKEVFSIFFNERRIGGIKTTAKKNADGTYQMTNQTEVNLSENLQQSGLHQNIEKTLRFIGLPGLQFQLNSQVDVDANFQLKKLAFDLGSSLFEAKISGNVEGNSLKIDIQQGEELNQLSIPYQKTETIPQGFMPFDRMTDLKIGKHWKIRYINPVTNSAELFDARVVDTEQIIVEDKIYDAFIVKIQAGVVSIKTWVAPDGNVLKVSLPFGLEIRREEISTSKKNTKSSPQVLPNEKEQK